MVAWTQTSAVRFYVHPSDGDVRIVFTIDEVSMVNSRPAKRLLYERSRPGLGNMLTEAIR